MSDGSLVDAQVTRSSGNDIFDRSAENAVTRAQPFKVPDDKEAFKDFRSFTFIFNP
jgi:colicin import membrane protein